MNAFPRFKPDGFPKDVYDELRVLLKNFVNTSQPSDEQTLLKIFQPKQKVQYKPIESIVDPFKPQVVVYPKTKQLQHFEESELNYNDKKSIFTN